MARWARIDDDEIQEIVEPHDDSIPFVEYFAPGLTWADISDAEPEPQPGWRATRGSDQRWVFEPPPPPTPPTLAERAGLALNAGCAIESTSAPGLSATYAITPDRIAKVMALSLYINVNGAFPAGQAALSYPDIEGKSHVFETPALFQAFATALADYVAHLDLVIDGTLTALPAQPVEIA